LIFANGAYDDALDCRALAGTADIVVCADGGGKHARRAGVTPHYLIGDMDSLDAETLRDYTARQVVLRRYPADKDHTDTQLALALLEGLGAEEITLLGTIGSRFDHSFGNLFSTAPLARKGIRIIHIAKQLKIYVSTGRVELKAADGDTVSLFPLTETADGVTTRGLVYPLRDAALSYDCPYAVSNCFAAADAAVEVRRGVLAVMQTSHAL
jgi:thiamine pyrophosphokinase